MIIKWLSRSSEASQLTDLWQHIVGKEKKKKSTGVASCTVGKNAFLHNYMELGSKIFSFNPPRRKK